MLEVIFPLFSYSHGLAIFLSCTLSLRKLLLRENEDFQVKAGVTLQSIDGSTLKNSVVSLCNFALVVKHL